MLPIEDFEDYLPSPQKRMESYFEGRPVIGKPFPYDSKVCELPPEMMFMHEAVFGADEVVVADDDLFSRQNELWIKKQMPSGDYTFVPAGRAE